MTDDHDAATCPKPAYRGRNKVGYRGGRGRAAYIRGQRGAFRGVNKIRGRGIFKPRVRGGARGYFKERSDTMYQKMKMTDPQGKEISVFMAVDADETTHGEANYVHEEDTQNTGESYIKFIADTGATEHMVNQLDILSNVCKISNGGIIKSANSKADLKVEYKGTIIAKGYNGKIIKLNNVLYSKNLSKNLFSIRKLIDKGVLININKNEIKLKNENTGNIIKTGNYDGKFWWLKFELVNPKIINVGKNRIESFYQNVENVKVIENEGSDKSIESPKINKDKENLVENEIEYEEIESDNEVENEITYEEINDEDTLQKYLETVSEMELNDIQQLNNRKVESLKNDIGLLWHYRLGHVSKSYLEKAAKLIPELKNVKFTKAITDCEVCARAKITRQPCNTKRYQYNEPLKLIHTDVMGPISPCTYKYGARYIITFVDDYTRYAWAYPMADKKGVHIALSKMMENAKILKGENAKITFLRLDNGTEYCTENMKKLIEKERITLEHTPPYTPNLNGTAERFNLIENYKRK